MDKFSTNSTTKEFTTWHLTYEGKSVHCPCGDLGENSIRTLCDQYNQEGKEIQLTECTLYCEMTNEQKLKLAEKTSPALPL